MRSFIKTSIIGGLAVILPIAILGMIFKWLFTTVNGAISPITKQLTSNTDLNNLLASTIVLSAIVLACFAVGIVIRTRLGKYLFDSFETAVLKPFPGYSLVKETVGQFVGKNKMPFSKVAVVDLLGDGTRMTGFITDEHENGDYTVFLPTGPNPTSGNICHIDRKFVQILDASVEDAMRSIISCGAGSSELLKNISTENK